VAERRLTLKGMDLAASVVFFALAVLVAIEGVRLGAGWDERGPQAGFFPFWLAILMGGGALAAFTQALRRRFDTRFFEVDAEIVELVKVGVPLALAIIVIPWTGLYLSTFFYVWLFAWWYGGFRWWTTLIGGLVFTGVLYYTLTAMRIPMPHSVLYERGLLPF
jgi:putative tricarboxylic transport membrane protein